MLRDKWSEQPENSALVNGFVCEWDPAVIPLPVVVAAASGGDSRLAVPEPDKRRSALELIKSVFKDAYAARTPVKKSELAGKLLDQSRKSSDATERYVLLDEAVKLGAEGDDIGAARGALIELVFKYQVDAAKTSADAWRAMLSGARSLETVRVILGDMNARVDLAVRTAKFDEAKAIGDIATTTAQRLRDVEEIRLVRERNAELAERRRMYEAADAAVKKLLAAPDDPDANFTVGRYRGLVEKDWNAAVQHLAKGSDELWKDLAVKSIAAGNQPAAYSAIGDAWFDAAATRPAQKAEFLAAAKYWYEVSKGNLTGVQRTRVENRITEAGLTAVAYKLPVTFIPSLPVPSPPAVAVATVPAAPPATDVATVTPPPAAGDDTFMPVRTFGDAKPLVPGAPGTARAFAERILAQRGNIGVLEPNGADRQLSQGGVLPAGDFEILRISSNNAGPISDADLAVIGRFKKLTRLHFQNSQITGAGLIHLKDMPDLEYVSINRCPLTDAGVAHLIGALPKLNDLNISYTPISDVGLSHVGRGMPKLAVLNIASTSITDAGLIHLRSLAELKQLNLVQNGSIGDAGMAAVAQIPNLERLYLDGTPVGDAGVEALVNHPTLQVLSLRNTRITDRAMAALARLKNLKQIWVTGSKVSEPAAQALRSQHPQATIKTSG
jgi:Leucine-rich repeat (LRR) protein